jgi:hypothetical protein
MKFAYEDLSDNQFEDLIIFLCQRLLGISVQGFSNGPDGGRDAKFVGTAELHPSTAEPWRGTVIIQAKHTNGYNRHFSESDFFSVTGKTTVLAKEIPRIKKLRQSKNLDHYMLFSNRRLAANAETLIRKHVSTACDIPEVSIYLCGVEGLELFLKVFPNVPKLAGLDPVDSPLIVSPDDLADVVQALLTHLETAQTAFVAPPPMRTSYQVKNGLNNMSEEYARIQLKRYLKETAQMKAFLAAPENTKLQEMYETAAQEFQVKIMAKRKDYQTFDAVLEYLVDLLFNRDPILRKNKRLTRAALFYMYWNCDIGVTEDVETNQTLTTLTKPWLMWPCCCSCVSGLVVLMNMTC